MRKSQLAKKKKVISSLLFLSRKIKDIRNIQGTIFNDYFYFHEKCPSVTQQSFAKQL